jgi:uncharacterized Zn finger protein
MSGRSRQAFSEANKWSEFGPRRKAEGIRAQTQRGAFGSTWWAGRWLQALEQLVDEGRLARGRSYARSGQVTKLDVSKRGVDARVQGSRPSPYKVTMSFKQLSDSEWARVVESMAAEAGYAAKLLSGEMPATIENAFVGAGATLFPAEGNDLETDCSCPDWSNPCKHVAAVFYLLGEQFDADPFLMFLLRGRTRDEIAGALRALRDTSDAGSAPEEEVEPETPLLAGSVAQFWSMPSTAAAPLLSFEPPAIAALSAKSLGEPRFWRERAPLMPLLEDLYRAVSEVARDAALK